MMDLRREPRQRRESIVPMINVAFLLLVFFMMVAVIAPPDPIAVEQPVSSFDDLVHPTEVLVIGPNGGLMRGSLEGDAVFDNLSRHAVTIRADARLDASVLAQVVSRLADAGVTTISLATLPRPAINERTE